MKLYDFFRSGASYRVRIALNFKGLRFDQVARHLRKGEQREADYLALNPQGLVPTLVLDDGRVLTQSLAIIEWLDETHPNPPLLPKDPFRRAQVRAFALAIAADTHPVQNLKILQRIKAMGGDDMAWAKQVNEEGLAAAEQLIAGEPGPFAFGVQPTLADICIVPQLGNARRFGADIAKFTRILEAETACLALPAFQNAAPEKQPDAE